VLKFDKIMKGFTKTITALDNLAESKLHEINAIDEQAARLSEMRRGANEEGSAASATANKLRELIGAE